MRSEIYSVLRQGIWASLTGGWYYDLNQTHFSNVFHFYMWLILFCFPIIIEFYLKDFLNFLFGFKHSAWIFYCFIIAIIFLLIKLFNQYLHSLFDSGKFVLELENFKKLNENEVNSSLKNDVSVSFENETNLINRNQSLRDHIEMKIFDNERTHSLNSLKLNENNHLDKSEIDCIIYQNNKTKVDVHHRNNSQNSLHEGSNSCLILNSVTLKNNLVKNGINYENLSKKNCLFNLKKDEDGNTVENSLDDDRDYDNKFETNSECKTLNGMIINTNSLIEEGISLERIKNDYTNLENDNSSYSEINKKAKSLSICSETISKSSVSYTNKKEKNEIEIIKNQDMDKSCLKQSTSNTFKNVDVKKTDFNYTNSISSTSNTIQGVEDALIKKFEKSKNFEEKVWKSDFASLNLSNESIKKNLSTKSNLSTKKLSSSFCLNDKKISLDQNLNTQNQLKSFSNQNKSNTYKRSNSLDSGDNSLQKLSLKEYSSTINNSNLNLKSSISSAAIPEGPSGYLLDQILADPGTHLAKSHDDSSIGAVHCFQDEQGNWLTYIFDENSSGIARGLLSCDKKNSNYELKLVNKTCSSEISNNDNHKQSNQYLSTSSCTESSLNSKKTNNSDLAKLRQLEEYNDVTERNCSSKLATIRCSLNSLILDNEDENVIPLKVNHSFSVRNSALNNSNLSLDISVNDFRDSYILNRFDKYESISKSKPKQFYKFYFPPYLRWKSFKIKLDRLTLLALLDRCFTNFELIMSILLAIFVAIFGAILIEQNIYSSLKLFAFCFVIASCQYTLLKSVQPDAASPTHGYNRIIIYSRPVYFILVCSIILCAKYYQEKNLDWTFKIYKINIFNSTYINLIEYYMKIFILIFPIIFTFGFLPQINTFLMHILEQTDIHFFGGSAATTGLTSAIYSILKSIIFVLILFKFALLSVDTSSKTKSLPNLTINDYNKFFSIFCGFLVFFAYFISRCSSDPTDVFNLIKKISLNLKNFIFEKRRLSNRKKKFRNTKEDLKKALDNNEVCELALYDKYEEDISENEVEFNDPLPKKLEETLLKRLENDLICGIAIILIVFVVHLSSIFKLQPYVDIVLRYLAVSLGLILNYFIFQFRKELPWLCFSSPFFKSKEYNMYEAKSEAKLMWFERFQVYLWIFEKNIIYPLIFISAITQDTPILIKKFGKNLGTLIMVLCSFKCIRSSFNDSSSNYIILIFTYLIFNFDFKEIQEPFLLNFFTVSILYYKLIELILKLQFVITYIAPWQITWGSVFHAIAQPFFFPHSGILFLQAIISSIVSSPLQPILGSTIFLTSYVRPIKFWEKDYNTKRIDSTNTRLISQLERNHNGLDDNNLNSIFYEHLTRSLQHSLYGDLILGRWGHVSQGDCFVLASDNLNCLVHIIELANGLVTFQVRGLEFKGTYCQQREVEAITEEVSKIEKCYCFNHCLSSQNFRMLSLNAAFNQRWLTWQITQSKYILEGYSISDNLALPMVQQFEFRKTLITYYIKCVIFYTVMNGKLKIWLKNIKIRETIDAVTNNKDFVDLDTSFSMVIEEDYDIRLGGISRNSFCQIYESWILFCYEMRKKKHSKIMHNSENSNYFLDKKDEKAMITLCFCLSLVARRLLIAASHNNSINSVELFLHGLYSLFKGDFRITALQDEWVFHDMDLLKKIIAPSVGMSVKLHQDHFLSSDEYEEKEFLFYTIVNYKKELVISHEADPVWRNAILSNVDSLLTIRHVFEDSGDQYKIIMLNKRYLNFRVIKLNKECVRGLWAGQQQELIYLRNRNAERGSIQNAKQVLRNIINSSCDLPIGYPIFVSPLTTSFGDTSSQLVKVIGKPLSFKIFKNFFLNYYNRLRIRWTQSCAPAMLLQTISTTNPTSNTTNLLLNERKNESRSYGLVTNRQFKESGTMTSSLFKNFKDGKNIISSNINEKIYNDQEASTSNLKKNKCETNLNFNLQVRPNVAKCNLNMANTSSLVTLISYRSLKNHESQVKIVKTSNEQVNLKESSTNNNSSTQITTLVNQKSKLDLI